MFLTGDTSLIEVFAYIITMFDVGGWKGAILGAVEG